MPGMWGRLCFGYPSGKLHRAGTDPGVDIGPFVHYSFSMSLMFLLFACQGAPVTDGSLDTDNAIDTGESGPPDTGELWGPEVLDLYDYEGLNHLLPTELLVSSGNRLAYSHALNSDTIAVLDLDTKALVAVHEVPGVGQVELYDGGKLIYVTRSSSPPIQTLNPTTGASQALVVGLESVNGVLRLSETKTAMAGETADGSHILQINDRENDHARLAFEVLPEVPRALLDAGNGEIAVVMGQRLEPGLIEFRSKSDLSLLRSCTAPFGAGGASLTQEGDVVLATTSQIGLAPCSETLPAREPQILELGEENMDVIQSPAGMLVLDRVGEENRNWSIARLFDVSAGELDLKSSFTTGKNSGRGGRDLQTGLVWMNSEGTTEVWAMEPATGVLRVAMPTGLHIESIAASDSKGVLLVSGRLSSLLARVDFVTGSVEVLEHTLSWPVAPVFYDGNFYVLDQLAGTLHIFEGASLTQGAQLDLGWDKLDTLTMSDAVLLPDRGSLLLSNGAVDEVVEVDLATFSIAGRTVLGAPLDRDDPGRLELHPMGNGALAVRSFDGRIVKINLESGVPQIFKPLTDVLEQRSHMQFSELSKDESLLYVGPFAVETQGWTLQNDQERDWSFPVESREDGSWVGWRQSDSLLFQVGADGTVLSEQATGFDKMALPEWIATPWMSRYIATDMGSGTLTAFTLPE